MTDHIYWKEGSLYVLDQRALPFRKVYVRCHRLADVIKAIKNMTIRGAPLIGIVAAYGVALGVSEVLRSKGHCTESEMERICAGLTATRPTAVNLAWALDRMRDVYRGCIHKADRLDILIDAAITIHVEDIENNRMLSLYGAELIEDGDTVLTHCNAGALATGGYGTALGVIRAAHEAGKRIKVIATETRPYLQGARLTAWELFQEGIDVELVPDNHAGLLCWKRIVDKVIVGADRIALNGDTANKIGTYMIALCARQSQVPFFVAAPVSTFDRHVENGGYIEIEERDGKEVKYIQGKALTVKDVKARYYSFDVTPARYISNFITEKGIIERPFKKYIRILSS
ncbi:MAG: Methylthioribose-1-phosphate isomerase [Syntrophorhabdus sp. PtaB.Bin006]|nr:MAG: Methylthioribose-1-phosphate isomerase [Syntrophorhabdus sp. PtaB.Bin006]